MRFCPTVARHHHYGVRTNEQGFMNIPFTNDLKEKLFNTAVLHRILVKDWKASKIYGTYFVQNVLSGRISVLSSKGSFSAAYLHNIFSSSFFQNSLTMEVPRSQLTEKMLHKTDEEIIFAFKSGPGRPQKGIKVRLKSRGIHLTDRGKDTKG